MLGLEEKGDKEGLEEGTVEHSNGSLNSFPFPWSGRWQCGGK